jgi:predicted nuclease of predicted toxin-antitoxin system
MWPEMKVLCDVHISYKVTNFFRNNKIEAIHVNEILDGSYTKDKNICLFADQHDYIVVTKDIDFRNSHFLSKTPKKLIRIGLGNISNVQLIEILSENLEAIRKICSNESFILEINSDIIYIVQE